MAAVGIASFSAANGWGLLNHFPVPFWLALPLAVIAIDFVIWLQHVMVHAVPALWRLHRVHHADLDYDLTTGSRFHPIEIVLSMLIKFATITVLGAPVVGVVIFEVVLNAAAMFNHGNIRLPVGLDRVLRQFIVTPDMHRVHHSVEEDETHSNFGFNLPWWDHLPRAAPRWPVGDDRWHSRPYRSAGGGAPGWHADDALQEQSQGLCHQPPYLV
jgi:sterol desaturase/sphingolipid hydroxylase (fatty acid hydroxylase superfamily)